MQTTQRTGIDDLAAAEHELREQYLPLAAGGRKPRSRMITDCPTAGRLDVCDVIND